MRLAIAAVILAALLGLGAVALKYRGDAIAAGAARDRALADLAGALDANRALNAALVRARAQAEINDRAMAGVAQELAKINASIVGTASALRDLETSNADVRAYLGTVVPPAVELQLNR